MRVYCIDRFDYLEHSGVKGMRWGHRKDGRSRGATNNKRAETIKKKVSKGRTAVMEALGLKKKPVPPPSSSDLNKKDIIRKGDVKTAYARRREFTDNELQSVINRYNKEQELKKLAVTSNRERVESITRGMDTATNFITTGSKLYNAGARIANATGKTELPIVDLNGGGKKKKKKKNKDNNNNDNNNNNNNNTENNSN